MPLPKLAIVIALLALSSTAAPGDPRCNEERPGKVFAALDAIDAEGEARLQAALEKLSQQERWTRSDWEKYTLGLSDNPRTDAREARRDDLVAAIFGVLARPPYDCARLDALEAEILELEKQQWDEAVGDVEKRLQPAAASPKTL